jgi:hypothetical protein
VKEKRSENLESGITQYYLVAVLGLVGEAGDAAGPADRGVLAGLARRALPLHGRLGLRGADREPRESVKGKQKKIRTKSRRRDEIRGRVDLTGEGLGAASLTAAERWSRPSS